jgi:hypothetical protein
MAAQAWKLYNLAKKKIGNATINLATANFRISLHQSASNFATFTLGLWNSVTSEVAAGNGYATLGNAITTRVWTVGASAKSYKFDGDDPLWTATGGTIPNIKAAVIALSGAATANRHLLCFASLTSAQFTLASGNTLTLQFNTLGIFTMA